MKLKNGLNRAKFILHISGPAPTGSSTANFK